MPRIARPISVEVIDVRQRLKAFLDREGLAVNAFALRAGIAQPVLHRFMSGRTKSVTPLIERALNYAGIAPIIGITEQYDVADHPKLRQALRSACDGRAESVELLASLIKALTPVLAAHRNTK